MIKLHNICPQYITDEAVPSSTGAQMRAIVEACKACDIPFRTLPGLGNIIDCKVDIKTLRDVAYKDLLRRKPVELDTDKISGYLHDKIVLVTGAGGSIGRIIAGLTLVTVVFMRNVIYNMNEKGLRT
ncbi:polysaccharide biosynthesis protein CapD [Desulfobacula toluolica]|uniref:Polysaccharide biosynthesis protein CapD n=1 Tax=Desulfobacula toluolica (strain DSM 7467 / Tol2) TaxID=651182 RepID=K0NDK0_DESTT|nr:polysaccharide biosynthesis protein CapD [Desulfobacula toluolica]CCK78971.1 polysaccharide biosynthesis protein CapD, fragment [Desulfobacula toluolica Tol2]